MNAKHRLHGERGQALPLFAISAVAILALMGLGLDGARVFLERRQAQSAADLAALAAARLLPDDESGARDMAVEIASANGFTIDRIADVTTPYDGDTSQVKVSIPTDVPMLFTALIGITNTPVTASAAAMHQAAVVGSAGTGDGYTIFVIGDDCSNSKIIDVTSAFYSVGSWHSNATVNSSSPNNPPQAEIPGPLHQGTHTYAPCPGGNLSIGDDGTDVWDTMWAPDTTDAGGSRPGVLPDPLCPDPTDEATCLTPNDFTCDYPGDGSGNWIGSWDTDFKISADGPHWVGGSAGATSPPTFVPGTICAAKIDWDVSGAVGEITAVSSNQIRGSKTGGPLTPHENGILFAVLGPAGTIQDPTPNKDGCLSDKAIGFSSPDLIWSGVWYVPCGEAEWTGPKGIFMDASIISYYLKTSATGTVLTGYDYTGGAGPTESSPEVVALVE